MYCVKVLNPDGEAYAASLDGSKLSREQEMAVTFESFEEAETWARRLFENWVVFSSQRTLRRSDRPKKEDPLQEAIEFLYGTGDSLKRSLVGELHNLSIYTKNQERQVKALEIARKLEAWK